MMSNDEIVDMMEDKCIEQGGVLVDNMCFM